MTVRVVAAALVLTMGAAACGDDAPSTSATTTEEPRTSTSTSTVPERPASTTTTAFDPASVEGQVEAAYLKSWDVYAHAVYHLELDEEAFAEVYAEPLLSVRLAEIRQRIDDARPALVRVEHNYRVEMTSDTTALLIDSYVNHQVLIDPRSLEPIEDDPNAVLVDAYSVRLGPAGWVVFDLDRLG